MKKLFEIRDQNRVTRDRYKLNLDTPRRNQLTSGTKNLKFYGLEIGDALPVNIKTAENLNTFKD